MPLSSGFSSGDVLNYAIRLRRRPVAGYAVIAAAIGAATLARWLLEGHVVAGPFVTYYPVIIIAALVGGFWAGVVSIACSGAIGWYLFLSAQSPFVAGNLSGASLMTFVTLSLLDAAIAAVVNKAVIRLTEQEKNVRSMVDSLPNGVMVITAQGIIASANPAAERTFGYGRSELIGRSIVSLVPDRFRDRYSRGMAEYLKRPRPLGLGPDREFKGKRKDGAEVSVEVGLTPIERYGETAVVATVIDISQRVRAQEHERLLSRELRHRTQNLFAVIQAIVARTMVGELLADAKQQLSARLNALAGVHSAIIGTPSETASLADIIQRELSQVAPMAIAVTGCDILVNAGAGQQFAMIVHELATNAFKYGALSVPDGRITVSGLTTDAAQAREFVLVWAEHGGPPVKKPTRVGFGSSILFEAAKQFGMVVKADFRPEGLVYRLSVAMEDIEPPVAHLVPLDAPAAQPSALTS